MEKSFLKWAGGKYRVLPQLLPILDKLVNHEIKQTYIEPFVGSGTVFLNFNKVDNYILNDSNANLMNVFTQLKEKEDFLENIALYFKPSSNDKDYFQAIVRRFNSTLNMEQKAAMFIYLNKHCFNGLMRFNKRNLFNTPFGKYKVVNLPYETLIKMKEKLKNNNVSLLCRDYEVILENAKFGDIVYCDPPYVDIEEKDSFKQYGSDLFNLEDQRKLAHLALQAAQKGAKVVISNHYTHVTHKLYSQCSYYKTIDVKRSIAAQGQARKNVQEIIAVYDF